MKKFVVQFALILAVVAIAGFAGWKIVTSKPSTAKGDEHDHVEGGEEHGHGEEGSSNVEALMRSCLPVLPQAETTGKAQAGMIAGRDRSRTTRMRSGVFAFRQVCHLCCGIQAPY